MRFFVRIPNDGCYAFEFPKSLSSSKQDKDSEYNGFVNKMQAWLKDYLSSSTI